MPDPIPSNARLVAGPYDVTLGTHQWDFIDGAHYEFRHDGTSPRGVLFRLAYDIRERTRQVRFVKLASLIEEIRQLAIYAGSTGTPVTFYPDAADPLTVWTIDWPEETEFVTETEFRETLTVRLTQQSPGS